MEPVVYVNGELLPLSEAKIPVSDRGFLYGDGIFETLRTYERRPFLLDAHLERLAQGAAYLHIPLPLEEREMKRAVAEVVEANPGGELYLRLTLTRGSGGRGLIFPASPDPTFIIHAGPLEDLDHRKGVDVVTADDRRDLLVFLKSLNFLPNLLARQAAFEKGAFEALLFDREGLVWEGTISNLFLVQGGKLVTPPAWGRVLAGVTRGLVMKLASEIKLECREALTRRKDLFAAEELFITNSLIELVPVSSVDGKKTGVEERATTRRLQAKYADFTRDFNCWSSLT